MTLWTLVCWWVSRWMTGVIWEKRKGESQEPDTSEGGVKSRTDVLVDVVVLVLVDGASDGLSSLDRLAHGSGVLVLRLETVKELSLLRRHLGFGLSSDLGLDVGLVLLLLVDKVGDGLDSVLVVVDMSLPVDGGCVLLVNVASDVLLSDGRAGLGADLSGTRLVVLGKEVLER